jgi:transposase
MADLWIRVGSDDRKKPVWAVVPFRMFRKPPEDAVIKWVRVHRFTVGSQDCWEVQFVVTRKDWVKPDNADGGIAGIDLNWRVTPDGIRVATLVGDDGRERTLTLPWDLISGWEKAESLQSIRDQNFDEARERLADWLQDREGLPGWVEERMSTLRTWKSCARLATQVRWWASNRFDGDEEMFAAMWAWRKQENHLHDWQDNQLNKSIRRRNETYRRFAAIVRREYQTVRVEDMNLHKMARRPGPDEKSDAAAKAYARVASVGTLRQYLREAVTAIELVPAALTTLTCFSCGTVNQFDAAQELIHTCSGCGEMWDQDRCAAINLLRQMNEFGPFEVREPDLVGGPRAAG